MWCLQTHQRHQCLVWPSDLPMNYTKRQCNEFMKLGLQGHSILAASGDYGVASFPSDGVDGTGCLGPDAKIFNPQYPGNCPYITSVGGTMLYPDQTIDDPATQRASCTLTSVEQP
jgi:tripeptidyl-peptidase I